MNTTTLKTPNAPATDAQRQYIQNLIADARFVYVQKRATVAYVTTLAPERRHDSRRDIATYEQAELLIGLWNAVVVPDDLTQQRASNWIEQLKKMPAYTEQRWLEQPKVAAAFGVAEYVNLHRLALEKAI